MNIVFQFCVSVSKYWIWLVYIALGCTITFDLENCGLCFHEKIGPMLIDLCWFWNERDKTRTMFLMNKNKPGAKLNYSRVDK